jgi:hypothetical protein
VPEYRAECAMSEAAPLDATKDLWTGPITLDEASDDLALAVADGSDRHRRAVVFWARAWFGVGIVT